MLKTCQSNRLEVLADRLADTVGRSMGDVFQPDVVLVQSDKMRRWLSLRLAGTLGIAANIDFTFPAAYLWKLLRLVMPQVPEESPFDTRVMAWRIMGLMSCLDGSTPFGPLREFLSGGDERRRFELARRISALFDGYLVYRPDWLEAWQSKKSLGLGHHERWQAELWRRLTGSLDEEIRQHPRERLFQVLKRHPENRERLPRRLSLFGVRDLPPPYWRIVHGLADYLDVHLFVLNPCREAWLGRPGETGGRGSLLEAWGGHGRVFLREAAPRGSKPPGSDFVEPGEDTLLHRLQTAILRGRELPAAGAAVYENPPSITILSCHGHMREMEVLHDQLVAVLEKDPDPADIGVLIPDIETYAPYIDAVFGAASPRIPYAIADLKGRLSSPATAGFLLLLDFRLGRFEASRVLTLLENPAVRRRYDLDDNDLDRARRWVGETGIHWGLDRESRRDLGLPDTGEHTWRAGLDRLLLGCALPGEGNRPFRGIVPHDVEGEAVRTMGKLSRLVEDLAALREELERPRSPARWAECLHQVIGNFLAPETGAEAEMQALHRAVRNVAETASRAGFEGSVEIETVQDLLRSELDTPLPSGHLTGRLTFGSLASLSAIPFRTVCLAGLNDGIFPSPARAPDFDLMARNPREGDRVRRDEDRYLLLEALLSARERVYISYIGQDVRDDHVTPPSILVADLVDCLAASVPDDLRTDFQRRLAVKHPLQPFSRKYFDGSDGRLFSYNQSLCLACGGRGTGEERGLFVPEPLPEPSEEMSSLELDQLLRFFQGPVRYFLQSRLGIRLEEGPEPLEDREPFALAGFKDGELRRRLLPAVLEGRPPEDLRLIARAGGDLPQGEVGRVIEADQLDRTVKFAERLREFLPPQALPPLPVNLEVAGLRLTGWLDRVTGDGQLGYEAGGIWDRDYLPLWIRHLVLHLSAPAGVKRETRWLSPDLTLVFGAVADPREHLERLVSWFRQGQRRPLPLFPKTSLAAARSMKDGADWRQTALKEWQSDDFRAGEAARPYHRLAFRETDPLDAEFEALARDLFLPLLDHLEEPRHA